ncbi:MAG TPA: phage portal protein, partial [Pseudomonas sp.]|nr:phage portal protein [Pseudomonas sp.]
MFFSSLLGDTRGSITESNDWWRGLIGRGKNSSGMVVTPETALGIPVLQNCVTLLAESIGQLPLELYRRQGQGQREAAINHPLYDVLRYQPNGFQTPYELRECTQLSAGLRGNGFQ